MEYFGFKWIVFIIVLYISVQSTITMIVDVTVTMEMVLKDYMIQIPINVSKSWSKENIHKTVLYTRVERSEVTWLDHAALEF